MGEKISLMRLVLLDKNCTQQNGILGEPRRLEKWFAYLATLTRRTNWAVVEQHGLVHQWRSSSGTKKERFGVFDQNSRFQKFLYYSSMDFREVRSFVEPFFGISNFGQKRQNAPFLGRYCSATGAPIHAALLLPSLSS